jgi:hypothetical protein
MSSPPTMAALQVEQMLMALEACGIRRSLLCRAIGLAPAALRDPEARIASSVPVALFAEAERITGDRLVGLHAGERTIPRGPLVYLLLSHPQIEVGFQQVQRFTALVADGLRIELIRQPRTVSVLIDVGDALAVTPHITDYTMSIVANVFRRVLGVGGSAAGGSRPPRGMGRRDGGPARLRLPRPVWPTAGSADLRAPPSGDPVTPRDRADCERDGEARRVAPSRSPARGDVSRARRARHATDAGARFPCRPRHRGTRAGRE